MNTARTDELIAKRGVRPNLSVAEWQEFIELVIQQLGTESCYRFCLYPYSHVPAKGYAAGFPGRIVESLQYLNILDLVVMDEEAMARLIAFLEKHGCPWEVTTQYDPDTDADEPIGIRVFGYSVPGE
jgi:hypothetical protein